MLITTSSSAASLAPCPPIAIDRLCALRRPFAAMPWRASIALNRPSVARFTMTKPRLCDRISVDFAPISAKKSSFSIQIRRKCSAVSHDIPVFRHFCAEMSSKCTLAHRKSRASAPLRSLARRKNSPHAIKNRDEVLVVIHNKLDVIGLNKHWAKSKHSVFHDYAKHLSECAVKDSLALSRNLQKHDPATTVGLMDNAHSIPIAKPIWKRPGRLALDPSHLSISNELPLSQSPYGSMPPLYGCRSAGANHFRQTQIASIPLPSATLCPSPFQESRWQRAGKQSSFARQHGRKAVSLARGKQGSVGKGSLGCRFRAIRSVCVFTGEYVFAGRGIPCLPGDDPVRYDRGPCVIRNQSCRQEVTL